MNNEFLGKYGKYSDVHISRHFASITGIQFFKRPVQIFRKRAIRIAE